MTAHRNLTNHNNHQIHFRTFTTQAERLAATGLDSSDLRKVAFQESDNTHWLLTSIAPLTWKALGGITSNTLLNGNSTPPDNALGSDGDFYLNKSVFMLYGPKAAGVWPTGVSIKGTDGIAGNDFLAVQIFT